MKFNRKTLFNELREWRGSLSQSQVNGINFIMDAAERDPYIARLSWLAYMLATTQHETADTFQPIHEYGRRSYFINRYGSQTRVGQRLGNDTPEEGADYAGRGDVQLTGEDNYEKAEIALRREYPQLIAEFEARTGRRFDLTVGDQPNDKLDPDNAQDPAIAYAIMSYGMRNGLFTGKKLSNYFTATSQDPINARRIINGTDRAEQIANLFYKWREILKASLQPDLPTPTEIENQIENIKIGAETPAEVLPTEQPSAITTKTESTNPQPESPPQTSLIDNLENYSNKAERVSNAVSKVSFGSNAITTVTMVFGWLSAGAAFLKDNKTEVFIAVSIIAIVGALVYAHYSKNRATQRALAIKG